MATMHSRGRSLAQLVAEQEETLSKVNADVSITAGDFNQKALLKAATNPTLHSLQLHGGTCHPVGARYDYMFVVGHGVGAQFTDVCVTGYGAAGGAHRTQRELGIDYGNRMRPAWPSDHPLLVGKVHTQHNGSECSIRIASWNVMTQGATRPFQSTWDAQKARRQGEHVVDTLANTLAPESGIDVICLQEAGGGQARNGFRGAWEEFYRPKALTARIRAGAGFQDSWQSKALVCMIDRRGGLPPAAPETWIVARHARQDAPGASGIGTITLVRSTALDYGQYTHTSPTRENMFGQAGHSCILPLIWSGGETLNTHITNVHALSGRRTRPFSAWDLVHSLGLK